MYREEDQGPEKDYNKARYFFCCYNKARSFFWLIFKKTRFFLFCYNKARYILIGSCSSKAWSFFSQDLRRYARYSNCYNLQCTYTVRRDAFLERTQEGKILFVWSWLQWDKRLFKPGQKMTMYYVIFKIQEFKKERFALHQNKHWAIFGLAPPQSDILKL